jgi:hypothetical protein
VWTVGSVSGQEARSAITRAATTMRLNFISRRVVTQKESYL